MDKKQPLKRVAQYFTMVYKGLNNRLGLANLLLGLNQDKGGQHAFFGKPDLFLKQQSP